MTYIRHTISTQRKGNLLHSVSQRNESRDPAQLQDCIHRVVDRLRPYIIPGQDHIISSWCDGAEIFEEGFYDYIYLRVPFPKDADLTASASVLSSSERNGKTWFSLDDEMIKGVETNAMLCYDADKGLYLCLPDILTLMDNVITGRHDTDTEYDGSPLWDMSDENGLEAFADECISRLEAFAGLVVTISKHLNGAGHELSQINSAIREFLRGR